MHSLVDVRRQSVAHHRRQQEAVVSRLVLPREQLVAIVQTLRQIRHQVQRLQTSDAL